MSSDPQAPQDQSAPGQVREMTIQIPFPENFIYANCAAFAVSLMEIRIGFGEAMQNGQAVARVGVVLPPEAAAVTALVLLQQVTTYEEKFGELRHPMWKEAKAKLNLKPEPESKGE
jgi:hypothetical protein